MIAYWKVYEEVGDYANLNKERGFASRSSQSGGGIILLRYRCVDLLLCSLITI
jgi:hypothetical protein